MAQDDMKLVNVKFDLDVHQKLEMIAKTRSMIEGKNITVTEVVRSATLEKVDATLRDHEFREMAKKRLEEQQAMLS